MRIPIARQARGGLRERGGLLMGMTVQTQGVVAVSLRSIDASATRSAGNTRALGTGENNGQSAFSHCRGAADNDGRETLVVGGD